MARIATATSVPRAFARPSRIVVEPSSAPTKAGSKYSLPMLGLPTCCCAASKHPAKPVIADDATKAKMTYRRFGIPMSSAARGFEPDGGGGGIGGVAEKIWLLFGQARGADGKAAASRG